ncbi:MAG TPA: hypothetical protein VIV55_01940 [Flavobacterium sp.]
MNENIVNQYKINFQNVAEQFPGFSKEIDKTPDTNNQYLSMFLYSWNAQDINETLIPDINIALSNPESEIENGSETISILIYQNKVDFYDDGFVCTIPTQDFKEIVIGWRDFLLTPPLNGTKV